MAKVVRGMLPAGVRIESVAVKRNGAYDAGFRGKRMSSETRFALPVHNGTMIAARDLRANGRRAI